MLINGFVEGEAEDMAIWVLRLNTNAVISRVREGRGGEGRGGRGGGLRERALRLVEESQQCLKKRNEVSIPTPE